MTASAPLRGGRHSRPARWRLTEELPSNGNMIWDPCLTRAVAAELGTRLRGARARAVSLRRDATAVVVHFRDATLVADLSPRRGIVVVEPPSEPGAEAEPLPAVLAGVEAVRDERVLVLRFRRVRGRKPHPGLILELATNRRNAVLAEGPELRVRKRLRMVKGSPLRIGQPWVAPGEGPPGRVRGEPDLAGWRGLIEGLDEAGARAALLANVAYTSGLNVASLLDAPTPETGFRRWRRMVEGADAAPHLLRLGAGPQPYPWPLPGAGAEPGRKPAGSHGRDRCGGRGVRDGGDCRKGGCGPPSRLAAQAAEAQAEASSGPAGEDRYRRSSPGGSRPRSVVTPPHRTRRDPSHPARLRR